MGKALPEGAVRALGLGHLRVGVLGKKNQAIQMFPGPCRPCTHQL